MTAKIINRHKRIESFINTLEKITNDGSITDAQRHKKYSQECTNEKRYLGQGCTKEQVKQEDNHVKYKITATTYRSYLTDYRNAILDLNEKNLLADKRIDSIKKLYKKIDLSSLNAELPDLRNNLDELLRKYRDTNQNLYKKLHSLKIEHHAFYCMRPSIDVVKRVKAKSSDNLIHKHTSQKIVRRVLIEQVLSEFSQSDHWVDLSIYVALASGRRSIETLKTGEFKKSKAFHVLFDGQAKTKGRDDTGTFAIPVLSKPAILINTHRNLSTLLSKTRFYGKHFSDLTNDEINGATAGRLNRTVRKIFGDEFTFKDLRAIYAKVASEKYHNAKNESLPVFYSKILGHSEKDIATQLSYQGILISEDKIEPTKIEHTTDEPTRDSSGQKTLKELQAFDSIIIERGGKAEIRVHEFIKETLKKSPDTIITQTFLSKPKSQGGSGCSRPAIKKYLKVVGLS